MENTNNTTTHYRNLSVNFRLAVAKNIPLGDVQFEQRGPDTGDMSQTME